MTLDNFLTHQDSMLYNTAIPMNNDHPGCIQKWSFQKGGLCSEIYRHYFRNNDKKRLTYELENHVDTAYEKEKENNSMRNI